MKLNKLSTKQLVSAFLTGTSAISLSVFAQQTQKPNIIYILTDDMGYADLGCYGSKRIKTPNIDRLAAEGIRFVNSYAGTSVSAPSRCSLMTGLHTGHCQIRGNKQWEPYGQLPLETGTVTVASKLKEAGYKTAVIGKWGLGVEGTNGDPNKQGFDYSYGYLCQVLAHNHTPEYLMENGKKIKLRNKVVWMPKDNWSKGLGSYPVVKKDFSQTLFTQKTLKFIDQNQKNPFFIYLSVIIPHDNGEAPKGETYSDIPWLFPYEKQPWTKSEKGYAAMITYLDTEVGKIMAKLKAKGLDKNTIVIFTSDNGADAPDGFFKESNYPLRGKKRDLYEGGIRTPFIVYWKDHIAPGRTSTLQSAFWDFMPTACELAGVSAPENTDGISYLPELLGKPQKKHESLYFEFHEQGGKQAIIKGDWKCIRLNTNFKEKMVTELYNITEDPSETTNLAAKYPEKVAELIQLMAVSRTENKYFQLF